MAAMGMIGIVSSALSGVVGAIGSVMQGNAQSSMYAYQSQVAQMNKQIAEQNAEHARVTGEAQAQADAMKTKQQIGTTRAVIGASGVDVNTGSAADVQESELKIGQYQEGVIRSDAAKKAYNFKVEAANQEAQSNVYSMASSNAKSGGMMGAFTSILGAATSVSSKWSQASTSYGWA